MIRVLAVVFFFIFVYGCTVGHMGAALLALLMVPLMLYGEQQLSKRDREFEESPAAARQRANTLQLLAQQDTEGSADRL